MTNFDYYKDRDKDKAESEYYSFCNIMNWHRAVSISAGHGDIEIPSFFDWLKMEHHFFPSYRVNDIVAYGEDQESCYIITGVKKDHYELMDLNKYLKLVRSNEYAEVSDIKTVGFEEEETGGIGKIIKLFHIEKECNDENP